MPKTKRRARIRHYARRLQRWMPIRRHRRDKRMPLSVGVGLLTSVFASPAPGYSSAYQAIQYGSVMDAAESFISAWTGLRGISGKEGMPFQMPNIVSLINPLDMSVAPALKATLISAMTMKLTKKFMKVDPLEKIPIVNKFVKFS